METQNIIEDIVITEVKKRGRPKKGMEKPKVIDEDPKPKKLGRPLTAWRHREDGTYNSHAIDPEYAIKYWRTHYRKPYTCGICGATLNCCGAIPRHEQSLHCQLAKLKKEETN
jgi:hypothetical protein